MRWRSLRGATSVWLSAPVAQEGTPYHDPVAIEVTEATFKSAVYDRSFQVPIVLELLAEYAVPSLQHFVPVLDRVVGETAGAVELVTVDVPTNPRVGAMFSEFQYNGYPAVYAIIEGQVVNHFFGARPEAAIRDFVARLTPPPPPLDPL